MRAPGPPARRAIAALVAAAVVLVAAPGCDNPACVFGPGNCQGGGGTPGALAPEAFEPESGSWIVDGAPAIRDVFPSGTGASTTTPIVIEFSESIAPSTLTGAFRIERQSSFGTVPVPFVATLVADGRMAVLLPQTALTADTEHTVVYASNANVRDLTGQALSTPPGAQIGTFTTAATNPTAPRVVASFPRDNATQQSATGEIVVVFDRPMAPGPFAGSGFAVTVGGSPPAFHPAPSPVTVGAGGLGVPDTRVWRWRSVDATGAPAPLGSGAVVALSLSPSGAKLTATGGGELPATIIDFTTAPFSAPVSASLASTPGDAIGIAGLTPGSGDEVELVIELEGAQAGDRVDVILFGTGLGPDGKLTALQRAVIVPPGGVTSVTFDRAALNLTTSTSPLKPRFADGEILVAVRLQRAGAPSPITLLDADHGTAGVQGLVLDTVRPTLVDLLAPGGGGELFTSDLEGLTLAGRASEPLRRVSVTTALGDNGPNPDVAGSHPAGWFVARPVPLGIVDPDALPLDYEFVLFDRALNASASIAGQFRQRGAAAGGPLEVDGTLAVEVFDAQTLAPVVDALVITHADEGDGVSYPFLGAAVSSSSGVALVPAHGAGQAGTIVSVDALGYDRFTFHDVRSARMSIPLTRTPPPTAALSGVVTTTSVFGSLTLPLSDLAVDDTRRPGSASPTAAAGTCIGGPFGQGLACPFGPLPIRAARIGARAFFAGDFELAQPNFSAAALIKAFEFAPVLPPIAAGQVGVDDVSVARLLNEPGVPAPELPVTVQTLTAFGALASGIDLGALVADAPFGAHPRITVDALLPGQVAPLTVGLGIAYPLAGPAWTARAAYPGEMFTHLEAFGDPSALLRVAAEWRDTHGASSRIALGLDELGLFGGLLPGPPVPVAIEPAPDAALAAAAFDVVLPNALLDGVFAGSVEGAGLYRVRLVDAAGRGWNLWRPDVADAVSAAVAVHVPDLTAGGGAPLASGPLVLTTGSRAYAGFDPERFLFSDLEFRAQFRTESAPRTVVAP